MSSREKAVCSNSCSFFFFFPPFLFPLLFRSLSSTLPRAPCSSSLSELYFGLCSREALQTTNEQPETEHGHSLGEICLAMHSCYGKASKHFTQFLFVVLLFCSPERCYIYCLICSYYIFYFSSNIFCLFFLGSFPPPLLERRCFVLVFNHCVSLAG